MLLLRIIKISRVAYISIIFADTTYAIDYKRFLCAQRLFELKCARKVPAALKSKFLCLVLTFVS